MQGDGESRELVTPPLDGTILPGITRDSILQLCREWGEFSVSERQLTIKEIKQVILHCESGAQHVKPSYGFREICCKW